MCAPIRAGVGSAAEQNVIAEVSHNESVRVVADWAAKALTRVRDAYTAAVGQVGGAAPGPFDGAKVPDLSLMGYASRLSEYMRCEAPSFVLASIYLDRLLQQRKVEVTQLSAHRLFLTAVVVAIKMHEDDYYSNRYYAQVGGISLSEMNRLEVRLLNLMDFRTHVTSQDYARYFGLMRRASTTPSTCVAQVDGSARLWPAEVVKNEEVQDRGEPKSAKPDDSLALRVENAPVGSVETAPAVAAKCAPAVQPSAPEKVEGAAPVAAVARPLEKVAVREPCVGKSPAKVPRLENGAAPAKDACNTRVVPGRRGVIWSAAKKWRKPRSPTLARSSSGDAERRRGTAGRPLAIGLLLRARHNAKFRPKPQTRTSAIVAARKLRAACAVEVAK
eukprot:TRINITY_DN30407_c0_g1_i1.p1 TRINITY_DN30407_c0_g1~~TRINITY_DN30407_c0_g1_i1.p1  ORF type:complete len:388 (+),score=57.05 TRINITY_DN30407_c0_g1_i1:134-1297(+)